MITIDFIRKTVCDYFNLPVDALDSKTRKREIVQARQIAMSFSKQLTKSSLAVIGAQIGNKDHATVLHACKTVNNLYDTDSQFRFDVDEIDKKINKTYEDEIKAEKERSEREIEERYNITQSDIEEAFRIALLKLIIYKNSIIKASDRLINILTEEQCSTLK